MAEPTIKTPLYELTDVEFSYPGRSPALQRVSLRIAHGGHLVLLGANGAGKSTLLMILAGLQHPTAGRIAFNGAELSHDRLVHDAAFRRQFRSRVGVLFQNPDTQLFCPTVRDEVAFGPLQTLPRAEALDRTDAALAAFRLEALADEAPYALSGGEKRRVALAAIMVMDPDVLLLDEPTANLDPRSCDELLTLLHGYQSDSRRTLITATHDLAVAAELGGTGAVLSPDNTLAALAPLPEVLDDESLLLNANLVGQRRSTRKLLPG